MSKKQKFAKENNFHELPQEQLDKEIEFVANKLEISKEELLSYLSLPKKTYMNYRNQKNIYKLGSKAFKIFKLGTSAKR